jgi:subtilisin family serine protease
MVGRREQQRRIVNSAFFDEGNRRPVDGDRPYEISPPRPEVDLERFAPTLPLARLEDQDDDLLVVPGRIAVRAGTAAADALRGNDDFVGGEPKEGIIIFEWAHDLDAAAVETTLRVVGELAPPGEPHEIAPLYGFRTNQTNHHSDAPGPTAPLPDPVGPEGQGIRIAVIDTGVNATGPWVGGRINGPVNEQDELVSAEPGALPAPNLGFAAGHGNHVAGVVHQVVPSAEIVVRRAVNSDGFVDEPALFAILADIAQREQKPDIVVLPLGGPAVQLGSFGTAGNGQDWLEPQLLLAGLELLIRECDGTVIVASAGNDESPDRAYPAAFTISPVASPALRDHMVAVAALDHCGFRACFSNYGDWVSASTLGVHIRSQYVEGIWPAGHDPDRIETDFRGNPYAMWSGTSFSTPAVAGLIALQTFALRQGPLPAATAVEGWSVLRATGGTADPLLGVKLPPSTVASA